MNETQAEINFEAFCLSRKIAYERIPEGKHRTPDYELTIGHQKIIVEVKEISPNDLERLSAKLMAERGYGSLLSNIPGERVRKKISDASAQMKARMQGQYPGLLVLFDCCGRLIKHTDPYFIKVAMYGLEQVNFVVPNNPKVPAYSMGMSFGGRRKMTEKDNTSISAIGTLYVLVDGEIDMHVYHNKFAAIPIDPYLLAKYNIRQYKINDGVSNGSGEWVEVSD